MTGARFFKADLQMQTPVDRANWRGPERITGDSTSAERVAVAEAFMRRCYDCRLEVIAVTDHNIAPPDCDSLIPELKSAVDTLSVEYGYEIIIFPGFEVEVTIGIGIHVLCIFEIDTTLEVLSEKLTSLGLPKARRFVDRKPSSTPVEAQLTLEKLIQTVQSDAANPGLIILAHATGNSGVMDRDKLMQWWSADVISDNRILCLELPFHRDYYLDQEAQPLTKSVLENKDTRYHRRHPIAAICSSDCKSLETIEGNPNHIGFRHTWIKMGTPSIEGLRQAFLDHDSRIRGGENPEKGYSYAKIKGITITGATFLDDLRLELRPNMNVLIGGSGTGKSTVVDYLRMCLDQAGAIVGDDVRKNYDKNLQTVATGTKVEVEIEYNDRQLHVTSTGRVPGVIDSDDADLQSLEVSDLFPVRFYGQREIYNIAENRSSVIDLIDDLHRADLDRIDRSNFELISAHDQASVLARGRPSLERERRNLRAQIVRTQTALAQLREAAEPLEKLAMSAADVRFLEKLDTTSRYGVSDVVAAAEQISAATSGVSIDGHEHLSQIHEESAAAAREFLQLVRQASTDYLGRLDSIHSNQIAEQVTTDYAVADAAAASIHQELLDQGIDPDEFSRYRQQLDELTADERQVEGKIDRAKEAERERQRHLEALVLNWNREQDLRAASANRLNDAVPRTDTGVPFVDVSLHTFGDDVAFHAAMSRYRGDRRRMSDDDWNALMAAILAASDNAPPTHLLLDWLAKLDQGSVPDGFPWPTSDAKQQRVLACFTDEARHQIATMRVPDRVEVVLSRQDGTVAGELEGGLSIGQKCTAVLALLLALDTTPAVIDQPEDEIDNEFIYREMVPLLRKVKERRQLIIVTHDPNIPVNGDAEFICALTAEQGRGRIKLVDAMPACGSLDEKRVRLAVEEIMEGSEDAFRRRFDKYGF